jgi:hypothetical protein
MVDRYRQGGQRLDELAAFAPRSWTRFAFNFMRSPEIKADREMVLAAASVLNRSIATDESDPISEMHQDEGWRLHQPAILRQGGLHESGM